MAELRTDITADSSGLNKGLNKGQAAFKGFAASAKNGLDKVKGSFGGLAGVIAAVGVGAKIKEMVDETEMIYAFSKRIDSTTESMQRLNAVVGLGEGIDLKAIVDVMYDLKKSLGDMETVDDVSLIVKKLGLSFEELKAADPAKQFTMIGEAWNKVKDMGTVSIVDLETLFAGDPYEIMAIWNRMYEAKLKMSQVSIMSEDEMKKVIDANKELKDAGSNFMDKARPAMIGATKVGGLLVEAATHGVGLFTDMWKKTNSLSDLTPSKLGKIKDDYADKNVLNPLIQKGLANVPDRKEKWSGLINQTDKKIIESNNSFESQNNANIATMRKMIDALNFVGANTGAANKVLDKIAENTKEPSGTFGR